MRVLGPLESATDGWEINVTPVELRLILGPQRFHRGYMLSGLCPPVVKIRPHDLAFFTEPTGSNAEDEPASGNGVQSGYLLS